MTIVNQIIMCDPDHLSVKQSLTEYIDELNTNKHVVDVDVVRQCKEILKLHSLRNKQKDLLPKQPTRRATKCYVCKNIQTKQQSDTISICLSCQNHQSSKREIRANLSEKVAIVTGARVKIGYETAIRLLQCGCTVVVTTRFPADAFRRYQTHEDYLTFKERLTIYAIDLRYMQRIDEFAEFITSVYGRLDILIHNAAQTLRRPKQFFSHLLENEMSFRMIEDKESSKSVTIVKTQHEDALLPLMDADERFFPRGRYDEHSEQIDLRPINTWVEPMGSIDMHECAELLTINTLAPFHMNQRFKSIMPSGSYIVNVSSMEGVFNTIKTPFHPQTNMAKAALNMMTKTAAPTYAKDGIYMVSVDTGWVTNEYPHGHDNRSFAAPLSTLDGACRILDPIFTFFNTGVPQYGIFLKDYFPSAW